MVPGTQTREEKETSQLYCVHLGEAGQGVLLGVGVLLGAQT